MTVPVTVTVPANFQGAFNRLSDGTLEDYRNDVSRQPASPSSRGRHAVKDDATVVSRPGSRAECPRDGHLAARTALSSSTPP